MRIATSNGSHKFSTITTPRSPARGTVLWLMGPTSAGKSTLANHAIAKLREAAVPIIGFDGDEVRDLMGPDLAFSSSDRLRVVAALAHLANKAADAGLHVVVSALTAGRNARDHIRTSIPNVRIGYVSCSISTCAQRDPKGLYKKAKAGEIDTLVGYNSAYQPPIDPDIVLNTELFSIDELAHMIAGYLADPRQQD